MEPGEEAFFAERFSGSFLQRLGQEFFGNTAQYPIANVLLELLLKPPGSKLTEPDPYIILAAAGIQAYALTRWQFTGRPRRLLGNLIAPALYTLVEMGFEGLGFFQAPHHWAFWIYAFLIGLLQTPRPHAPRWLNSVLVVLESFVRASILLFMYVIFESYVVPEQTLSFQTFFLEDKSHVFIAWALALTGFSLGLANLIVETYLQTLRQVSAQLKTYSEWLLGPDLLLQSFRNPQALKVTRRERTILFMDIRGFTQWSEARAPEEVAALLEAYYHEAEAVLTRFATIKYKLTADEVMAVFADPFQAYLAALALREKIQACLTPYALGAGIGLECGLLIEGILGGARVKFYDVLGDTVNTAQRIESMAGPGEILVSERVAELVGVKFAAAERRELHVKGKTQPVIVYRVADQPPLTS